MEDPALPHSTDRYGQVVEIIFTADLHQHRAMRHGVETSAGFVQRA